MYDNANDNAALDCIPRETRERIRVHFRGRSRVSLNALCAILNIGRPMAMRLIAEDRLSCQWFPYGKDRPDRPMFAVEDIADYFRRKGKPQPKRSEAISKAVKRALGQ